MFLCVYIHVHTLNGNVIDFAVDNFSLQYDIQALLRIWKLCIPIPHTPSKNSSRCLLLAGNDFYIFLSLFDTVSIYLDAQEKSKKQVIDAHLNPSSSSIHQHNAPKGTGAKDQYASCPRSCFHMGAIKSNPAAIAHVVRATAKVEWCLKGQSSSEVQNSALCHGQSESEI